MTMYDPKADERTFDDHKGRQAVFPAMTEADHAMAYAKEAFKRLTGYPAEERRVRGASMGAAGAMAYAEDIFTRMKGYRMNHPYDFDYHLHRHRARDDHVARGGGMRGTQAERAMIYAKDVFKRLRGLPAQEPLGSNRCQDEVHQHRRQHPGQSGGGLRNNGRRHLHTVSTAKMVSSYLRGFLLFVTAVGRAMMRLALLIRRSILDPYARRRRRRIALAQLKALDDRLLADIGLSRNNIERVVDDMLARRDDTSSHSATRSLPTEDRRHDLPLAA
jgi:uncharacterized protein YjiS (DUF1127 family)